MKLSKHVLPVTIDDKSYYFESIHQKLLPVDSDEELLKTHFFLAGQEEESLRDKLFVKYPFLRLIIVPTWECNLRCTHCCVIDKLVKKDLGNLDASKLESFLKRYLDKFSIDSLDVLFCGGEPLLRPDSIIDSINAIKKVCKKYELSITTNLVKDLTDIDFHIMSQMDIIGVSIDGIEGQHNEQRKSAVISNPYQKTMYNLKQLMLKGFRDKISVQSTQGFSSREEKKQFAKEMLRYGVNRKAIIIGTLHPTRTKPVVSEDEVCGIKKNLSRQLWHRPCCKYQHMSTFLIDSKNNVYTDFYVQDRLGTLDDDIELISERFRQSILNEMPCLHDQNCRNCPIIGVCWGKCAQVNVSNKKPSDLCDVDVITKNLLNYLTHKHK
jgi:radical SAM protein with 4Fe4S-binding SPASM domain